MTATGKGRLAIGLIGAGRLGASTRATWRAASRRPGSSRSPTRWSALAQEVAAEFDVPRQYADPLALIDDPAVDAVVIVSPTHTHRELVIAAARAASKPTFCEKPPALSLDEVAAMQEAVADVRHVLPDGIHAPVRRRLRVGEEADRGGAHRHAAGLQVDVARSVPAEPRVRQSEEQRRHADRHGHPRLRSRALVHGRGARRCRRSARRSRTRSWRRSATSTTRWRASPSRAASSASSI